MKKTISFQGELGSYSHQACLELDFESSVRPCLTFEAAIDSVVKGLADFAMLPVENSTYGRVADIHSLLPKSGLKIVREHFLRVRINLLAVKGTKLNEIKDALSHTVLLGQCRKFLSANNIKSITGLDTAGSAKKVAMRNDKSVAALASKLAGEIYGLDTLACDIEDMSNNTTRFLLMSQDSLEIEKLAEKHVYMTTLVFQVRNIPSALYKALGGFATNGINMLKLESYMIGGSFTATQFYLDIEGHPEENSVKNALDELTYFTSSFSILGVYKKHPFRESYISD
jgi:prephenate dehydratase